MSTKALLAALLSATTLGFTTVSHAQSHAAVDEIAGYLDFNEYGGGVIFAEQIPHEAYKTSPSSMLETPHNLLKSTSLAPSISSGGKC